MPIAGTANTNIDLILCQRKAYERHRKRVSKKKHLQIEIKKKI